MEIVRSLTVGNLELFDGNEEIYKLVVFTHKYGINQLIYILISLYGKGFDLKIRLNLKKYIFYDVPWLISFISKQGIL